MSRSKGRREVLKRMSVDEISRYWHRTRDEGLAEIDRAQAKNTLWAMLVCWFRTNKAERMLAETEDEINRRFA